jgi:hypothetical protein
MRLFEWWARLPRWLRVGVALAFLLMSTILWLTIPLLPRFFFQGWLAGRLAAFGWAVGAMLLLFSFPSKSERKGYHDF